MKIIIAQKKKSDGNFINSIQSSLIKWYTKSEYYHSEIILCDKWISSTPSSGVRIRDIEPLRDDYDYYLLESNISNLDDVMKFIYNQEHKAYDWKGIFLSAFLNFNIHSKSEWYCSEFVTVVLNKLNILNEIQSNTITPAKLTSLITNNKYFKGIYDARSLSI